MGIVSGGIQIVAAYALPLVLFKIVSQLLNGLTSFDNSPSGRLMRTVFFAFAEFERDMIVQRTTEGKELCRKDPEWKEGRPKKDTGEFQKFLKKQKDGLLTVEQCCARLSISRRTWYNRVAEA